MNFAGSKFDSRNDFEEMGTRANHKRAQTSGHPNILSVSSSLNTSFGGTNKIPVVKDNQN